MIPHYRCVRGTDDGCAIYQCLLCGETWEWRGGSAPVRFCMFCGGPLISKLDCREQDTPRWLYDWQKTHGESHYIWERSWRRDLVPQPCWVVEHRCIWLKDGRDDHLNHDWKFKHRLNNYRHTMTAHEAYEELQRLRQEEAVRDTPADPDYDPEIDNSPWFRYEFRLVRERP